MTPQEARKKITELFEAAVECQPAERAKFLQDACADDEALLAKLSALVAEYGFSENPPELLWSAPSSVLHRDELSPTLVDALQGGTPSSMQEGSGTTIGSYRLVKELGSGGM